VVFDAGATLLKANTLVEAQDAAVFLGSADTEQPLLVTASRNQLSGVIKGVTIELHGVSDKPVTLGVTRSVDALVEDFTEFTEKFNELTTKIKDLTKFDVKTNERGLLLGESTAQTVETEVYAMMQSVVNGAGQYRILSQIGLRVGAGAQLEFDEEKFRAAYATDPDSVKNLFVLAEKGAATLIEGKINKLIDPVSGVITRQNQNLDDRTTQFQDRIESLDKLLTAKRTRLERQFAQLETVLAGLQSQQQALGAIQTITPQSRSGR
jgi:flagellar hook-associated protein 2